MHSPLRFASYRHCNTGHSSIERIGTADRSMTNTGFAKCNEAGFIIRI
ncbi:hypothetical protein BURMUCGD2M_4770 [Burkholderia multivorans CGD2M]|uniref:Uncharacterized protein n=1 Tax=Burkholderia multivorans CGD2 TaxID=513052 RepID=B9BI75_9BURK|nr:hypothetical protein BURMUCGD2_4781 [Burkholderia multivorans CGD2]EEE15327.1 hypothetical protein BURMUCGD2M_4770 [Burkholderia multivorans CGD2M]